MFNRTVSENDSNEFSSLFLHVEENGFCEEPQRDYFPYSNQGLKSTFGRNDKTPKQLNHNRPG